MSTLLSSSKTGRCCDDSRSWIGRLDTFHWPEVKLSKLFVRRNLDRDKRDHKVGGQLRKGWTDRPNTDFRRTSVWPLTFDEVRLGASGSPRSSLGRSWRRRGRPGLLARSRKVRKFFEQNVRHFDLAWQRLRSDHCLDFHSFLTEKKISSELQIWNERTLPDVQWTVCLQIRHQCLWKPLAPQSTDL